VPRRFSRDPAYCSGHDIVQADGIGWFAGQDDLARGDADTALGKQRSILQRHPECCATAGEAGQPPASVMLRHVAQQQRAGDDRWQHQGQMDQRVQKRAAGVEGADLIIAINTDLNAPIFEFAHIGVVTDATEMLPALTEAFRRRLSVNRLTG
jgi:hypothetical protein